MVQQENKKKIPVHIDVDTGTDDAIALICALLSQDKIELKSVSAVAGNVPLVYTAANTLNLLRGLGSDVIVAKGAEKPLVRELECTVCHGETGLGSVTLKDCGEAFYEKHAVDTIYESACAAQGELVYLGVAPETNLALALQKYPDLKDKIKRIYVMGGALHGGNMTLASEFNAYVDPEAFRYIVNAGIPMTMVGLDVTLKTAIPQWFLKEMHEIDNKYAKMAAAIMDASLEVNKEYGYDEANIHDALAFMAIVNPELLTTKKYYVDVETEGTLTRGMTVADFTGVCEMDPSKTENIDCAVDVDLESFWNVLLNLFKKYEEGKENE